MFILFDTCCHFEERRFKKLQNSCCMVYLAIDSLALIYMSELVEEPWAKHAMCAMSIAFFRSG